MYLLDAKRKAERKARQREAKERQERRREERRQLEAEQRLRRQQQQRQQQQQHRQQVGPEEEERQLQRALQQSKAEEAQRRREEAELQEALRRSVEEDQRRQGTPSSAPRPQQRLQQRQPPSRQVHQTASPRATTPTSSRTHSSSPQESADDPERLLREWRDAKVSCKYVGTFEAGRPPIDRDAVKAGITVMTEYIEQGRPAHLLLCLEGIKVIDGMVSAVVMAHALQNVTMCTVIKDIGLFGFVARDPQGRQREQYCHVFHMNTARQAQATHAVVSKAFKLAFYKHRTREEDLAASTESQQAKGRRWAKHNPLQGAPRQDMRRGGASRAQAAPSTPSSSSPLLAEDQARQQQQQHQHQQRLQERQAQVGQRLRKQRQYAQQQQQQQQQQPRAEEGKGRDQEEGEVAVAAPRGAAPGRAEANTDFVTPASPTPRHTPRAAPLSSVGRHMSGEEQALASPDRLVQQRPQPSAPPLETLDQEMQELELLAESQQDEDDGLDDFLRNASWYQAGLPRDIATELLAMNDEGTFLVRESQSHRGHFALTMKGAGRIHNFIIKRTPQGFMLGSEQDGERVFHDLGELILHHAEHRGVLPCRLNLDATNALSHDPSRGGEPDRTSFIDPDYESLRDINF